MLKFKTSCAVLANLSSNLLNEVGLFLFRYFEVGLRVCDIVVNKFTFAISSPDEFLLFSGRCGAVPHSLLLNALAASSGKRNVTVCCPSVCLSVPHTQRDSPGAAYDVTRVHNSDGHTWFQGISRWLCLLPSCVHRMANYMEDYKLVAWHSGRTSVCDRRTFPVLRLTCS